MKKRNSLASGFIDSALVEVGKVTELAIMHGIEVTCLIGGFCHAVV